MKSAFFIITILICNFMVSQETYTDKEKDSIYENLILKKIDSLNYSESDFKKMKKYFSQNKEVLNLISNRASQGNKDAVDFIEILTQPYDQAIAKHTKNNIDLLIFAYYGSKKTLDKFKELEQAFDAEIDSLKMHKAYFDKETQKEIDEYKIKIDSLKKE